MLGTSTAAQRNARQAERTRYKRIEVYECYPWNWARGRKAGSLEWPHPHAEQNEDLLLPAEPREVAPRSVPHARAQFVL